MKSSLLLNAPRPAAKVTRRLLRDIADGPALGDTMPLADLHKLAKLKKHEEE
jgi:hypothetical protein